MLLNKNILQKLPKAAMSLRVMASAYRRGHFLRRGACLLALLGVGSVSAATLRAGGAPTASDLQHALPTTEFTLANGLRVIVREDHRAPTVLQMLFYKAGSLDELNGTTGAAHVLEHMMFRGTQQLGPGEFSQRVAALGGSENAFTMQDCTAYFTRIEKSHLSAIMALEADRMQNLAITSEIFDREIRVVMEERRLSLEDKPEALLDEALRATAYNASPARWPVIGWQDDLQQMTWLDARAWYERWYAPNNALLVVAGDITPAAVRSQAERWFGAIPARPLPVRKAQNEPLQRGLKRVTIKAPAEVPRVVLAFKVMPLEVNSAAKQEAYALSVLAAVLDGYPNARLEKHLVREQRLADWVDASYSMVARGPQLFTLSAIPAQGRSLIELEAALRSELRRIAQNGVSARELQRVKTQLYSARIYGRDSVFSQVMEIGLAEMAGHSWRAIELMDQALNAVTAQDVQAVAARYFIDEQLTVATLMPEQMQSTPRLRKRSQGK